MPILSETRRYAKSALSLVGRDIINGLFKTLNAATLVAIEDETENELSAYDIGQAQLHMLSDGSSDDEDNVNNIFHNLDRDDCCIDALMNRAVLEYAVKKYKNHRSLSACITLITLYMECNIEKEKQMTFKRSTLILVHILMSITIHSTVLSCWCPSNALKFFSL